MRLALSGSQPWGLHGNPAERRVVVRTKAAGSGVRAWRGLLTLRGNVRSGDHRSALFLGIGRGDRHARFKSHYRLCRARHSDRMHAFGSSESFAAKQILGVMAG